MVCGIRTKADMIRMAAAVCFMLFTMAGADSQPAVPERPANKDYDSVAWHDITAKQKQRDSVWDRVHRYIFRRRNIETATEGTVTAIETVDETDSNRYAEPVVSVYAVTSEKNCAQ